MKHILVKAQGLRLTVLARSTCDAIIRVQQLYPHRHGFSARVIPATTVPVPA